MNEYYYEKRVPIEFQDVLKWFGLVLFMLCLITGYLFKLEEEQKPEPNKREERRKKYIQQHGYIGQDFIKDTTYENKPVVHVDPLIYKPINYLN